ncbi:protein YbaO [Enterobacter cloacae subsp. cloacae GS1]|nr:protein YbaO [Enterobacter cloacae subsp. cloacae GS1]
MLDKIDRKLLSLLQSDCTLSLQALADAVNLTTTPCWKRLKKLEDDGILLGRVALLDPEKLGLGLTAFVLIKTTASQQRMVLPLRHAGFRHARGARLLAQWRGNTTI